MPAMRARAAPSGHSPGYWKAEAPFLAEPNYGSDAYITQHGMMAGIVTTFDGAKLKFRK